jgi:hypothetical protein
MRLKELITLAPVLVLPNDDLPFRLEADGSGIATGAVLSQQQVDDNVWHPVAFLSKALNPVEQNYEIHDTKMLAIIQIINKLGGHSTSLASTLHFTTNQAEAWVSQTHSLDGLKRPACRSLVFMGCISFPDLLSFLCYSTIGTSSRSYAPPHSRQGIDSFVIPKEHVACCSE